MVERIWSKGITQVTRYGDGDRGESKGKPSPLPGVADGIRSLAKTMSRQKLRRSELKGSILI
ncbi:hypothetical protein E2562_028825 [Oryza meyeriana var. granulata]|uniref:Uncharacterized protein n=1 Tax=Oryza meyeriana var. granulata TaxID=110450 RepID=A0A6G1FD86_9ORYZ|nr:hypothetical protein E2562_028825 [Oryza meyeriana var. granulata]